MSVFREIRIEWDGVGYDVVPSNKLIRRIQKVGDINIVSLLSGISSGSPNISEIAFFLAEMLRSVGAKVDEDDVYAALLRGDESLDAAIQAVVGATVPPEGTGRRAPTAPTGAVGAKKKRAPTRT